jgi:secondary thiamine-phosphate synthase enzyme
MAIHDFTISVATTAATDVIDISGEVDRCLARAKPAEGLVHLFIAGSTAALTTIEYEQGVVNDFKKAIERLVPQDAAYEHDRRWHDGNGNAHVRAALIGPSLTIPVRGGTLLLGTWQQIVLCDFDNRPRKREVLVRIHADA